MKFVYLLNLTVLVLFVQASNCKGFQKVEELVSNLVQNKILSNGLQNGNQGLLKVLQSKNFNDKQPINIIFDVVLNLLGISLKEQGYNIIQLPNVEENIIYCIVKGTNGTLEDLSNIIRIKGKDAYAEFRTESVALTLPFSVPNALIDYDITFENASEPLKFGINFKMDLDVDIEAVIKSEAPKVELNSVKVGKFNIRDVQIRDGTRYSLIKVVETLIKQKESEMREKIEIKLKEYIKEITDKINGNSNILSHFKRL